ncbi:hypothetical protein IMG5_068780, partial [Ichthyophthirius multifiliis]
RLKLNIIKNENCLVCISGGANSTTLTHLVGNTIYNSQGRKMFFKAELIYIDESVLYENKYKQSNLQKIEELAKKCQLKLNVLHLSDIYNDLFEKIPLINEEQRTLFDQKLIKFLNLFKNVASCQEDIVQFIKTQLYIEYAYKNNFNRIFLGSCGQRLASKIFSLFSKGRGGSADNEIQFIDWVEYEQMKNFFGSESEFQNKIGIGRPLKDFLNKEVLNYLHLNDLLGFLVDRPYYICENNKQNSKLPGFGNIDFIMENFIDNIQENFCSTTHTILHTSEKIIKKFTPKEGILQRCPLCFQFRDQIKNILEIETFDSSLGLIYGGENNEDNTEECLKKKYFESEKIAKTDIRNLILCFGCRRIIQNLNDDKVNFFDSQLLPQRIIDRTNKIAQQINKYQVF